MCLSLLLTGHQFFFFKFFFQFVFDQTDNLISTDFVSLWGWTDIPSALTQTLTLFMTVVCWKKKKKKTSQMSG